MAAAFLTSGHTRPAGMNKIEGRAMNIPTKKTLLRSAVIAVLLCGAGAVAMAQGEVIKERREAMKGNGGAMKAIKAIVEVNGSAADAVAPAQKIADTAAKIPDLFPKGSDTGDETAAKPEIWQNWDDFKSKAGDLKTQADLLVSAAQSGDLATVKAQFEKVGAACGACHKAYKVAK
jgi:cytochrome c556